MTVVSDLLEAHPKFFTGATLLLWLLSRCGHLQQFHLEQLVSLGALGAGQVRKKLAVTHGTTGLYGSSFL